MEASSMLPPLALLPVLATIVPGTHPVTNDQAQLIAWGIAGVILVIAMQAISLCFAGVRAMRRTPPLHETFATRSDLAALASRVESIGAATDTNLKEIFDELRTIHRSLGRVESLESTVRSMHDDTNERLKELNARLKE